MLVAEQGGNVYAHPYDLGVYENLITVSDSINVIHTMYICIY